MLQLIVADCCIAQASVDGARGNTGSKPKNVLR
ncbi:MAG: hypothetical protein RLZZ444_1653, partial [Pseudomonadota bacterium]